MVNSTGRRIAMHDTLEHRTRMNVACIDGLRHAVGQHVTSIGVAILRGREGDLQAALAGLMQDAACLEEAIVSGR